ncbi:MAG: type II secretion system F family protein, partial [Pirellulales bacterium]
MLYVRLISALAIVLFGILLLIVGGVRRSRRPANSAARDALSVIGLMVTAAAGLVVLAFGLAATAPPVAFFLFFAVIFVGLLIFFRRWRLRNDALLGLMASTVARGLPLESMLGALACDPQSGLGRRTERLTALLKSGVPLPDALWRVPGLVPNYAVLAARCGQVTGRLGQALHDAADQRTRRGEIFGPIIGRLAVLVGTVVVGMTISVLWARFVVPKIELLFEDFEISLPALVEFCLWVGESAAVLLPVVPLLLLALLYGLAVYIGMPNIIPLGPLRRNWETGPLLRNLALFAESGQSMVTALDLLGHEHSSLWMRRRLIAAAQRMDAGLPLGVALRKSRLLSRTNAALGAAAELAGNLAGGLRTVAESSERRLAYR